MSGNELTLTVTVHFDPRQTNNDQIRLHLSEMLAPGEGNRGVPGISRLHFHDGHQLHRDSATGRFTTAAAVAANPAGTTTETG